MGCPGVSAPARVTAYGPASLPSLWTGPSRVRFGGAERRWTPEVPSLLASGGADGVCGFLADGHHYRQTFGGTPKPITAPGRDRWLVTSSWGTHVAAHRSTLAGAKCFLRRTVLWGTQWGQLDRLRGPFGASARGDPLRRGLGFARALTITCYSVPSSGGTTWGSGLPAPGHTVVTWLILPVVICLSQRLSHACLSISNLYGETANGSLNQCQNCLGSEKLPSRLLVPPSPLMGRSPCSGPFRGLRRYQNVEIAWPPAPGKSAASYPLVQRLNSTG